MAVILTVGGFLGAGKTTLITRAAGILARRGARVGVITNDQAAGLMDTALVGLAEIPAGEVAGACFCCAFDRFVQEADVMVRDHAPDVILAEPVGSCVDIAATVLRPLARETADRFSVAPFTVVVDPAAWRLAWNAEGMPRSTAYIYHLQLLEADILALNKMDVESGAAMGLTEAEITARNPGAVCMRMAAATGAGVEPWLDGLLQAARPGGEERIEVDYDEYAEGEAALGWLNATVEFQPLEPVEWGAALDRLMESLVGRLRAAGTAPAHLKMLLRSGDLAIAANAVAGRDESDRRILLRGEPGPWAGLLVNARVPMGPGELQAIVQETLLERAELGGLVLGLRSFAPARPVPIHRMA